MEGLFSTEINKRCSETETQTKALPYNKHGNSFRKLDYGAPNGLRIQKIHAFRLFKAS